MSGASSAEPWTRNALGATLLLGACAIVFPFVVDVGEITDLLEGVDGDAGYLQVLLLIWLLLYIAAAVFTLVDAVRLVRRRDIDALRRATVFTKLAGIPFFLMNFAILGLVVWGTLFFGIGFVLAPFAITWTYLLMLPTSVYGLGLLVALRRVPAISTGSFTLHVVLHLLFVVDIVSTLIVAARARQLLTYGPPPPDQLR